MSRAAVCALLAVVLGGPLLAQDAAPVSSASAPPMRGVTLPLHSLDPAHDYGALLRELPALGVTHVCVVVKIFQTNGKSATPGRRLRGTPNDLVVLRTLAQARRLGLEVVLLPALFLVHPSADEWRGNLAPPDWGVWFAGYRRELLHFARLAEQAQAAVLVVGSELSSAEAQADLWRGTIERTRRVFSGRLTYAANWDHYQHVPFWEDLDYVGLSAYYELADGPDPTLEQVLGAWKRVRGQLLTWRAQRGLRQPLVFLEVGYTSVDGTLSAPWDYTRRAPLDLDEQALGYEAFARCWGGQPALAGCFFYEWWGEGGAEDRGYTPRGKPAAKVLERFYRAR
ncbi:MAG: hypothetical protein R3F62_00045 [Planctomycetota bacterium]